MNNPLVSIIVPCYNQAQYLSEALQSVLDQTYVDWECIIVNDGSPDNTEAVAQEWLEKDTRFKYIYKENGGLSSARNEGLNLATGQYIQFLDADDALNKFKFEKQLACFNDKIDIVISDYFPFDNETKSFKRERYMNPFPNLLLFKNEIITKWEKGLSIPCHCVIFEAKLINQKNGLIEFDESLENHEDWTFWVRLFYYSTGIFNLKYSLANYRIHDKSMCHDLLKMNEGLILACRKNIIFFEELKEVEFIELSKKKKELIFEKKSNSLKEKIKLFIPPIVLLLKRKIFSYKNV
jgi:hypothetical protein